MASSSRSRSLRASVLALAAIGALPVASGCSRESSKDDNAADVADGEAIYSSMCKSCHGARGEGGRGPVLRDIYKRMDEATLASFIDERMPLGEPERCDARCSKNVGAYVWRTLRGDIVCNAPQPLERGLRLLTRREYRATIEDLFGAGANTSAAPTGSPSLPCGTTTFTYDPKGRSLSTVHVAGSFNGWAGTIAQGGYALALANGTWSVTKQLPVGSHQYKLVLNESEWIVDPANTLTADNGLGGQNSRIDVTCPSPSSPGGNTGNTTGNTTGVLDVTDSFPPDTRPEGFAFDDHGPGRVVTSVLIDEQMRAAAAISASADVAKMKTACGANTADREACTGAIVKDQGKRIFRRPLEGAEIARYVAVARTAADLDKGVRAALKAMLVSPSFLYRSEVGEKQPDGTFLLTPWEIASSLSYFFTGSMPDAELFAAAESGELRTPAGIEKHARRLLASPRARGTVATIAEQWLGIESLSSITKEETHFPLPANVRASMLEETRRFVTHVVFDGSHDASDLFGADYTFLDEALAKHYGIAGVTGAEMRLVKYGDGSLRAGVLGHGSVLATTGHSDQTSPIRRGLFVRRRLLCQEFAPPPPNAGGVPAVDPNATTRQRFAQHTANPFCKSCHQYIDDVGFGFERFDTVGRMRDKEGDKPVDAQGDMNDVEGFGKGTHAPFSNLAELGRTLAASDAAKTCVARQAWRFARGRLDDDICQIAPVKQRFLEKGGDLRELFIAIAVDPAFVVRK